MKRDLENQIRGLLKIAGLLVGTARGHGFAARVKDLAKDSAELAPPIVSLLIARDAVEKQLAVLDRRVQARSFMTIPGVGLITALCFRATIDDPTRFRRSRSVGAYLGLTTRRYASGEIDWTGHISKRGDAMLRSYLFEAAGVLLTRVQKWSKLKAWASSSPSASA